MITGLPPYKTPVEIGVRCLCLRYYVVLTGANIIGDAEARARERAENLGATFVDARVTPFLQCECGQALDFVVDESLNVM